jgi:hypothetical protein
VLSLESEEYLPHYRKKPNTSL